MKICEVCQQLVALVEAPNPRKSSIVFYNASGTPSSLNEKEREKEKEMERDRDRESCSPIFHERILPLMPRFRHPVSLSPSLPLFPPSLSPYISHAAFLSRARAFFGLWSESQHPLDRSGLQSTSRTRHCRDFEEVTVIRKLVANIAYTTLYCYC